MYELLYKLLTTEKALTLAELMDAVSLHPVLVNILLGELLDKGMIHLVDGKYTMPKPRPDLPPEMKLVAVYVENLENGLAIHYQIALEHTMSFGVLSVGPLELDEINISFNTIIVTQIMMDKGTIYVAPIINDEVNTDYPLPGTYSTTVTEAIEVFYAIYQSFVSTSSDTPPSDPPSRPIRSLYDTPYSDN